MTWVWDLYLAIHHTPPFVVPKLDLRRELEARGNGGRGSEMDIL